MTLEPQRGGSFGRTAEQYEAGRPGYPPRLLQDVFDEIRRAGAREDLDILDLAAGTGKLTRQLTEYGSVVAVEPLVEMREQLIAVLPDVACLEGSAEAIPLADSSVDVVAVGQAYHWFDQRRANPEIWRVLRDGGWLLQLWNNEDESIAWIVELNEIMSRDDSLGKSSRFKWPEQFDNEPWFTEPVRRDGSMVLARSKRQLLASMESHSYLSIKPPAERRPILDEVARLIEGFPDPFDLPYVTVAYLCRKLPASAS